MFDNLWRGIRRIFRRFKRWCRNLWAQITHRNKIEENYMPEEPEYAKREEIYDTRIHTSQVRHVRPHMSED